MTTSLSPALIDDAELAMLPEWINRGINAFAVRSLFGFMDALGVVSVPSQETTPQLRVTRDLCYGDPHQRAHRLDVWAPTTPGPHPAVLFIHGGGFRAMSRRTHWMMARAFARRGHVVFTIDYRLAPEHRAPAPLQDAARALAWIKDHGADYGADLDRLVFAGESAGANIALALAMLTCAPRHEAWARDAYALNLTPRAVVSACGVLQVTDIARLWRATPLAWPVRRELERAAHAYLLPQDASSPASLLADPLRWLEHGVFTRPLPAIFAPVGSRDPLVDDSRRLGMAMRQREAICQVKVYPGGVHSFMAFLWTNLARQCWEDTFAFLDAHNVAPAPQRALTARPDDAALGITR